MPNLENVTFWGAVAVIGGFIGKQLWEILVPKEVHPAIRERIWTRKFWLLVWDGGLFSWFAWSLFYMWKNFGDSVVTVKVLLVIGTGVALFFIQGKLALDRLLEYILFLVYFKERKEAADLRRRLAAGEHIPDIEERIQSLEKRIKLMR